MAPIYFKSLSLEEQCQFLSSLDTILTDCDGVIWMTTIVINGAVDVFNLLQAHGKSVFYITNNSMKDTEMLQKKFLNFGFDAKTEHIISTAQLASKYLEKHLDPSKLAYVIGMPGFSRELDKCGVKHFGIGPDPVTDNLPDELDRIEIKENVGAVVVGFDQHVSYAKLIKAATYLDNPDCLFVGTNKDSRFPVKNKGYIIPGTGAFIAAVETAAGRKATVVGKPEKFLSNWLQDKHKLNPKRTIMIGDRCNTDILFGNRCGFSTLFVLTGTHSLEDVERFKQSSDDDDQKSVPQYYTDSIADLLPAIHKLFDIQ